MCTQRKDKVAFPFERRREITAFDMRGTFEADDGGHRKLKKDRLLSANKGLGWGSWPSELLEAQQELTKRDTKRKWKPVEEICAVGLHGKRRSTYKKNALALT